MAAVGRSIILRDPALLAQVVPLGCLSILVGLASFGKVQDRFLPDSVAGGVYMLACVALATTILRARGLHISIAAAVFALGLTSIVTLQVLFSDGVGSPAVAKAGATALIFVMMSSIPALNPASLIRLLRAGATLNVIVSALIILLTSAGVRQDVGTNDLSWVGWFDHKNYLGLAAAMAAGLSCAAMVRQRRATASTMGVTIVSIVVLIGSHSRGALLWLLVFACCWFAARAGIRLKSVVRSLLGISVALTLIILLDPGGTLSGFSSVSTGRTEIWEQARSVVARAPWIGHGMGASYRSGELFFDVFGNVYKGVHNGYIAILIDTGILGLFLYLIVANWAIGTFRTELDDDNIELLSVLGAFLAYNCIESAFDKTTNLSFVVFPLVLAAHSNGRLRSEGRPEDAGLGQAGARSTV